MGTFTDIIAICMLTLKLTKLLPSVSVYLRVSVLKGPTIVRPLLCMTAPAPGLTPILASLGIVPMYIITRKLSTPMCFSLG